VSGVTADRGALLARIVQVYGSASSCARFCGLTRQALNRRLLSASTWSLSHAWWALVLGLQTRVEGLTVEQITAQPVPTVDQLNQIWSLQASVWQVAHAKRNTRRTEIVAARRGAP
jgi:hypothetical protein